MTISLKVFCFKIQAIIRIKIFRQATFNILTRNGTNIICAISSWNKLCDYRPAIKAIPAMSAIKPSTIPMATTVSDISTE